MKIPLLIVMIVLLHSICPAQETGQPKPAATATQAPDPAATKDEVPQLEPLKKAVEKLTEELVALNDRLKNEAPKKKPGVLCAKIILKTQPLALVRKDDKLVLSDRMKGYKRKKKQKRKIRKNLDVVSYKVVLVEKVVLNIKDGKIKSVWFKYQENVNGNGKSVGYIASKSGTDIPLTLKDINDEKVSLELNSSANPGEYIYLSDFLEFEDYFKEGGNIPDVVELNTEKHEHNIYK